MFGLHFFMNEEKNGIPLLHHIEAHDAELLWFVLILTIT